MEENNNLQPASDFSDIPALDDKQGLEAYLNNEVLAAQGLQVQNQPTAPAQPAQPAATQAPADAPAPAAQPAVPGQAQQPAQGGETITLSREQFNALLAGRAQPQQPVQQAKPAGAQGYTAQEQIFIQNALAKGYSLDQINNFLKTRGGAAQTANAEIERRISDVEKLIRDQEYKAAETAFVNKLSSFGNKWGLSEQDLVTFGNEALKQGINIAMDNVNLETVFRAVYPDQYAIRAKRMSPTNASQIYGGTSIPEGNRTGASKLEDAYVEQFLKGAMPNQYGMLNKK